MTTPTLNICKTCDNVIPYGYYCVYCSRRKRMAEAIKKAKADGDLE